MRRGRLITGRTRATSFGASSGCVVAEARAEDIGRELSTWALLVDGAVCRHQSVRNEVGSADKRCCVHART